MRILIGCEESQEVCKAFRTRGHEAYSCDILPCSGGHPEWHYQDDVLNHLNEGWDLGIFFPPCTYFARPGMHWNARIPGRDNKRAQAFEFVQKIWSALIKKICLENPPGWLSTHWKTPTQIIHPWYFGDDQMKETALFLKGLPRLNGLHEVALNRQKYKPKSGGCRIGKDGKVKNKYFVTVAKSAKIRSKTFPGIAKAMAEQWG